MIPANRGTLPGHPVALTSMGIAQGRRVRGTGIGAPVYVSQHKEKRGEIGNEKENHIK